MATYERETRVRAPFQEVWEFHSRASGLEALTPDFVNLRVEAIRGADGESLTCDDVLDEGAELDLTMRPFGVGPRQRWTSVIYERFERDGAALFRDEMIDGPFPVWLHTHAFYADGAETLLRDTVRYRLPLIPAGDVVAPAAWVGFEGMFRNRHRRTRELLE